LRFLEVRGRVAGAETIGATKNEIPTALNKPDDWHLVIAEMYGDIVNRRATSAVHFPPSQTSG